jgi:nucleotide-binding universal stress UspA family protein
MAALRSILCPVDFSEESRQALRCAEGLARRHGSRLIVLSAVDPLLAEAARVRLGLDLAATDTGPALREFVRATWPGDESRPAQTAFDVRVGDASEVILQAARRDGPDLIVMATHGLGGARKWLLGSTAERVLRQTTAPMLIVPVAGSESGEPSFESGRILAASDFGETSLRAVQWAADFAEEYAVPLLIVHVVEPVVVASKWRSYMDDGDETRVREARGRLQTLAEQLSGMLACESVVALGRPADTIASIAEERGARLIVMGLANEGNLFAARPGSIAYRVLCLSKTPTLVVPFQSAARDAQS